MCCYSRTGCRFQSNTVGRNECVIRHRNPALVRVALRLAERIKLLQINIFALGLFLLFALRVIGNIFIQIYKSAGSAQPPWNGGLRRRINSSYSFSSRRVNSTMSVVTAG